MINGKSTVLEPWSQFKLNKDQELALECFKKFIDHESIDEMALCGSAGTGKSFVSNVMIDYAKSCGWSIKLTATTHKAVSVIKKMNEGMEAITIHKLLGLKMVNDFNNGGTNLEQDPETSPEIDERTLIIIDESSMINNDMLELIRENNVGKVLFIGDAYQLNPVGMDYAPVFKEVVYKVELTIIQRQSLNNPVIAFANQFRLALDGGQYPIVNDIVGHGNFLDTYNYETDQILCYTNNRSRYYNNVIRKKLGYPDDFYVSEQLIANDTISRNFNIVIRNNDRLEVVRCERCVEFDVVGQRLIVKNLDNCDFNHESILKAKAMDATNQWRNAVDPLKANRLEIYKKSCWREFFIYCEDLGINNPIERVPLAVFDVEVFVPDNNDDVGKVLNKIKAPALKLSKIIGNFKREKLEIPLDIILSRREAWSNYFLAKSLFADIRSPFACTTHKSQGSTYENVFIDVGDIGTNKNDSDIARLMYVALTRTSNNVTMTGQLPLRLYNDNKI